MSTTHSSCSDLHSKPHLRGHKETGGVAWCIPLSSCTPRYLRIQPKLKEISALHSNFPAGSAFAALAPVLGKKFYLHIKEDSNEIELRPCWGVFCTNQESRILEQPKLKLCSRPRLAPPGPDHHSPSFSTRGVTSHLVEAEKSPGQLLVE